MYMHMYICRVSIYHLLLGKLTTQQAFSPSPPLKRGGERSSMASGEPARQPAPETRITLRRERHVSSSWIRVRTQFYLTSWRCIL